MGRSSKWRDRIKVGGEEEEARYRIESKGQSCLGILGLVSSV